MKTTTNPKKHNPGVPAIIPPKGGEIMIEKICDFVIVDLYGSVLNIFQWTIQSQTHVLITLGCIVLAGIAGGLVIKKIGEALSF